MLHFIDFQILCELHEKEIEEKGRQLTENIIPISYRASIEDEKQNMFLSAGWIKAQPLDGNAKRQHNSVCTKYGSLL